ncbi:YciI family protein [Sphingomonas bacterium]|uniref:YciI family protein n=1 Tax=Sphingomonas bacterium TaxID=1895847 RepID=UPI0015765EC4|nr:YciI family protein [Sphingomonas bacterium]
MSEPFARPNAPLCIVLLTYDAPLDAIDAAMKDHVAWLATGYDQGVILMSGRQVPRTGGAIIFRGDEDSVEAVVATDPFVVQGLATTRIVAFTASMAARDLADLLG